MSASRWIAPALLATTVAAAAQVPVTQEPRHRVVFENAVFRILDVNVPPGDTSLDHRHDRDIVTVSMNAGTDTRIQATGQPWGAVRPRRGLGNVDIADYTGKPASHRVENVGQSAYQLFGVENLRASGWSANPALSASGTTVASESRAFRVYDVRLGTGAQQTSHTHAVPTIVLLISGKVMSEGSDAQAKANAPAPVGLKQLDGPGQWLLVPGGDAHHMVRLGNGNAQIVEVEIR